MESGSSALKSGFKSSIPRRLRKKCHMFTARADINLQHGKAVQNKEFAGRYSTEVMLCFPLFSHLFMCTCIVHACACMFVCGGGGDVLVYDTCVEGREQLAGVWKSVFFLHYIGSEALTQVVRLGSKHLYPLSHLTGPNFLSFRLCPCVNVYTGMPVSGDFILNPTERHDSTLNNVHDALALRDLVHTHEQG